MKSAAFQLANVSLLTVLSVPCLAQDAADPPIFGSLSHQPLVPPPVVEGKEIIAPALAADDAPVWDGDKPFEPASHEPVFPAAAMTKAALDAFKPAARAMFNLADTGMTAPRIAQHQGHTLVKVDLEGVERTVRLRPHNMRAESARLIVQVAGGGLIDQPWPEPVTYRGTIDGDADAEVAASIIDGKVSMMIHSRDPQKATWFVQPLSDALPGMPPAVHVAYRDRDVIPTGATCGVNEANPGMPMEVAGAAPNRPALAQRVNEQLEALAPPPLLEKNEPANDNDGGDEGGVAGDDGSIAAANVRCQLGLDADVEFYQANGSSVVNTIYDMETVMNQVGLIYQNQVAISYTHNVLFVRTAEPDPYTSTNANTLLCQFGEWWNTNVTATRDVAQLFTGKDLDGTTVGLAWIGSICPTNFNNCNAAGSNLSYGLVQSRFATDMASRVQDSAHELGHNWNGCHCNTGGNCGGGSSNPANCGIMTSGISGQLTFDATAVTAITTYRDGRACLEPWFNPVYVNNTWGGSENGSISNPFNTIFEGIDATLVNGTLVVQAGNYFQNPNIFKAKTIQAVNGTVRIGN